MSHDPSEIILIQYVGLLLKKQFLLLLWAILNIFVETFYQDYLMNSNVKRTAFINTFETEVFCNIINVITVTFDQFNAFLLKKIFFTLKGSVVTILNMRVHFSCISLCAQSSTQMQKWHNVINSSHPPLLKFLHLHPENSTQGLNVATCITIPQKRLTAVAISSLSICISKGLMKQSPAKLLFFNADYLNTVI